MFQQRPQLEVQEDKHRQPGGLCQGNCPLRPERETRSRQREAGGWVATTRAQQENVTASSSSCRKRTQLVTRQHMEV